MRSLLVLPLLVSSVASAAPTTERREVAAFHAVDLSSGLEVSIGPGAPSLVLEGDAEALWSVTTTVTGGTLSVQRKGQGFPWKRTKPVTVRLTTPALSELSASGGCDITLAPFPNRTLTLKLSGGVTLEAKGLELDQLTVEASGGVEATLAGQCREASVDLSGGVVLDARALTVTSAAVQASGGCQVALTVLETVGGDANGGVDLVVHGHPRSVKVKTSGAATVSAP
ncbi:MAG: DUF2807 domain-containing protein [Myxococcaceae bacterium]|nr:DUF2807 domain-containing protein [Myxococcaceae bacterium]